MISLNRRSVLRSSLAIAAGAALARPYIANAAATTATVWWVQGFAHEEDTAFQNMVADYEKASGNRIEYSIVPFAAMRQKEIAAVTSGVVPDIIDVGDYFFAVLSAWNNQLEDLSDVIETQKRLFMPTALQNGYAYNNVEKKRSYYMIPNRMSVIPFHVWKSLLDKAGYKPADIPKTWDAFLDFFPPVAEKLRAQGRRNIYAGSIMISAVGFDAIGHFDHFMIAYGGKDLYTPDGKVHTDDPKVREAAIKTVTRLATAFKQGFMPPAIQNWNDNDDNNAFHSKLLVMDFDGSLSTEVALWKEKEEYNDILTLGLPLGNDGKPVAGVMTTQAVVVPKGAPNVTVAKEFLKYSLEPKVLAVLLKVGLGRRLPPMTSIVENDKAFWLDPKNEPLQAYTREGIYGPTIPPYEVYNPARAQVSTERVFPLAILDVINKGVAPEAAVDKAFKRTEEIFAKYPIAQS
ncbi:MAG: carbohydrate ABC transporter substrate-binding protein [Alphaproteobacteria bacterium]|nr:carbohydrate ABC transporter substrate-binding protein [Alphaproteobacteria bacterium]